MKIFDEKKRNRVLAQREQLINEYKIAKKTFKALNKEKSIDFDQQQVLLEKMDKLSASLNKNREKYDDIIPRLKISECPFSHEPLIMAFDPVALDGLWWMEFTRRDYSREQKPSTFQVLRGALALNSFPAGGGRHEALIGPGVPYTIPRILELPTMIMVISQIQLDSGHTAYPLAYFSSQNPGPGQLTSSWLENNQYYFADANGKTRWSFANDSWDFDIGKWVEQGKIRWILPNSDRLAPASRNSADCPYCELEGLRLPQIVKGDQVFTEPLPDPSIEIDPFD